MKSKLIQLCFSISALSLFSNIAIAQPNLIGVVYEQVNLPALAFADFNSDGLLDALTPQGCSISFFEETPGEFLTWDSSYMITEPLVVDIDNDGDLDFYTQISEQSYFFCNDGTGQFEIKTPILDSIKAVGFEDLNSDGLQDLLAFKLDTGQGIPHPELRAYHNSGQESTWSSIELWDFEGSSGLPGEVLYKDLDNDGDKEIVAGLGYLVMGLYRLETGLYSGTVIYDVESFAQHLGFDAYHLNGDGFPDLTINGMGQFILVSDSALNYNFAFDHPFDDFKIIAGFDFNVDGCEDLLVRDGNFYWKTCSGIGEYLDEALPTSGGRPMLVDYDNDGIDELLLENTVAQKLKICETNESEPIITTFFDNYLANVQTLSTSDLNSDSLDDLIMLSIDNKRLLCCINAGQNNYEAPQILVENAESLHLADLNQDGRSEIVFIRDNQLNALYLNESLGQDSISLLINSLQTNSFLIKDFNKDSFPDLVFKSENTVEIWINNSVGQFNLELDVKLTEETLRAVHLADWNSDSQLDVIASIRTDSSLVINAYYVLNDSLDIQTGTKISEVPGPITPAVFSITDWSGDGVLDLVYKQHEVLILARTGENLMAFPEDTLSLPPGGVSHPAGTSSFDQDVSHDGYPDIVTKGALFIWDPQLDAFGPMQLIPQWDLVLSNLVADFNGNGLNEIITADTENRVSVWEYEPFETPTKLVLQDSSDKQISCTLYPNPTAREVHISVTQDIQSLKVFNRTGELFYQQVFNDPVSDFSILVADWPEGYYFVNLGIEQQDLNQRFLLVH